jgi:hypothetical protein
MKFTDKAYFAQKTKIVIMTVHDYNIQKSKIIVHHTHINFEILKGGNLRMKIYLKTFRPK